MDPCQVRGDLLDQDRPDGGVLRLRDEPSPNGLAVDVLHDEGGTAEEVVGVGQRLWHEHPGTVRGLDDPIFIVAIRAVVMEGAAHIAAQDQPPLGTGKAPCFLRRAAGEAHEIVHLGAGAKDSGEPGTQRVAQPRGRAGLRG